MKKMFRISLFFLIIGLVSYSTADAQKFGYLNLNNLIVELPAAKKADTELETLRKQLFAKREQMVKDLQAKADEYTKDASNVAPVVNREREQEVQDDQDKILEFEQEIAQKLQEKRAELYEPIFAAIDKALEEVGKEGNYTMIFNESTGALLFNIEADDVAPLVKAKLNL